MGGLADSCKGGAREVTGWEGHSWEAKLGGQADSFEGGAHLSKPGKPRAGRPCTAILLQGTAHIHKHPMLLFSENVLLHKHIDY